MRLVARHRDSKSEKSVPLGGKTLFGTRLQVPEARTARALPGGVLELMMWSVLGLGV